MFKIGDKVNIVRKGPYVNPEMEGMIGSGKELIITSMGTNAELTYVRFDGQGKEGQWSWYIECLDLADGKKKRGKRAAIIPKPVKEKKKNKFDVGDRVKVLPIHLYVEDKPHGGRIGEHGEEGHVGKLFTIDRVVVNDKHPHPGYYFKEEVKGHYVYVWDERYLKRVRKAVADKPKVPKVFKVGDTVKVLGKNGWDGFVREMDKFIGKELKVTGVNASEKEGAATQTYGLNCGEGWNWAHRCLELVNNKKKPKAPPVMERVPLTKENAVVGMEVICIDQKPGIINGNKYKIKGIKNDCCMVEGSDRHFFYRRFVFEQPLAKKKKKADVKAAIIGPKAKHIHQDLLEGLAKQADEGAGTCSYAIKYADGYIDYHVRDACHRRIGGRGNQNGYGEPKLKHGQRIALALNIKGHLKQVGEKKDTYLRYVNYIISQSPHRDSFLSKGVDHALKNGILMDTKWCVERLAGGAVSLREGSEYKEKLKLFGELLDAGYSGHVAYTLSYGFTQDYKYSGISDAHASISGTMSAESYFKFFKEGYPEATNKRKAFNKSDECYVGICRYLDWKLPGKSINDFLREETAIKGDMAGGWDAPKAISVEDRKAKLYALADKLELLLY